MTSPLGAVDVHGHAAVIRSNDPAILDAATSACNPPMSTAPHDHWPDLSRLDLRSTTDALHLWSQVVGKIRLMMTPWTNHSWHVPLYVCASGLTTGLIPAGPTAFEVELNFLGDVVIIRDTNGQERQVKLQPQSVAAFYGATMQALVEIGVDVQIDPMPCELADALPFAADDRVRAYDGDVARAYWRVLVQVERVLHLFRTRFVGKCSPIHLFWGSFDLAVTRFSGRQAPPHPGGAPHMPNAVARDAYSQEVSSAGFWPGGGTIPPSFYSYAYPVPKGFADAAIRPISGRFDRDLGEFLLSYEDVRASLDPTETLLDFLQSTYEAAANLGQWNRDVLEQPTGSLGRPP